MPKENPAIPYDPHGLTARNGYGYQGRCADCGARIAATLYRPTDRDSTAVFLGEMFMNGYLVTREPETDLRLESCRCGKPKAGA